MASGPSAAEMAMRQGMAGGGDPFAGMSQSEKQALFGSAGYQTGAWKAAAQSELKDMIVKALRDWKSGAGSRTQSMQMAIQAAALIGAHGGLTEEMESGVGAIRNMAAGVGAGALVPYVPPGALVAQPQRVAPMRVQVEVHQPSGSTLTTPRYGYGVPAVVGPSNSPGFLAIEHGMRTTAEAELAAYRRGKGDLVPYQPGGALALRPGATRVAGEVDYASGPTIHGASDQPFGGIKQLYSPAASKKFDEMIAEQKRGDKFLEQILAVEKHIDQSADKPAWRTPVVGDLWNTPHVVGMTHQQWRHRQPWATPGGTWVGPAGVAAHNLAAQAFPGITAGGPIGGGGGHGGPPLAGGGAGGGGGGGGGRGGGRFNTHLPANAGGAAINIGRNISALGGLLTGIPFVGGMLGGATMIAGGAIAAAGHAYKLIAEDIPNLQMALRANIEPYYGYAQYMSGMRRDTGASQDLTHRFYPGIFNYQKIPSWMSATGTGPLDAMRSFQRLGVKPEGTEAEGVAAAMATLRFTPGLGTVPGAEDFIDKMAKMGLVKPTGGDIGTMGIMLGNTMQAAMTKGMDASTLLESMATGITRMAESGAAATMSPQSMADFLMRFSALPGGATGAVGLKALGGMNEAIGEIGNEGLHTMVYAYAAQKIGAKGLPDFFGKFKGGPEFLEKFGSSDAGKEALSNYKLSLQRGDSYSAARWLGEIVRGFGPAEAFIPGMGPFFQGIPTQARPFAEAGFQHMEVMPYRQMQLNPEGGAYGHMLYPGDWKDPANTGYNPGMRWPGWTVGAQSPYDRGLNIMGGGKGIRSNLKDSVYKWADFYKINPLLIAAHMMIESTGGRNPAAGVNVMQMTKGTAKGLGFGFRDPTSEDESIQMGAALIAANLKTAGGDPIKEAALYYGLYPSHTHEQIAEYQAKFGSYLGQGGYGGNVPDDLREGQAAVAQTFQTEMSASNIALHTMNTLVPVINTGLQKFRDGIITATDAVKSFTDRLQHAGVH